MSYLVALLGLVGLGIILACTLVTCTCVFTALRDRTHIPRRHPDYLPFTQARTLRLYL